MALIATFGLGPDELARMRNDHEIYAHVCDRMVEGLREQLLRVGFTRLLCPVEDTRNGEGYSVRVAFRLSDLSNPSRTNSGDP
jgi:hypothetical protein